MLPADTDTENITASFKKGVLTVTMKKVEISETKKISVMPG